MAAEKMPWFRLYTEIVDNEKIRLLAFEDRWHFVAMLALKRGGILDADDASEMLQRKVAVKLGLQLREVEAVASRLAEVGLIDSATYQPLGWDVRQYSSDSSAERTRAYRRRQRDQKRHRDVTATGPDTETDSDPEKQVRTPAGVRRPYRSSAKSKGRHGLEALHGMLTNGKRK